MRMKSFYLRLFCFGLVFGQITAVLAPGEELELALDRSPLNREDPKYLTSYAPILREAKEAVVAVHSASILRVIRQRGRDPRMEILRRYFGLPAPEHGQPQIEERRFSEGVGSGVVISSNGYILTNSHVITTQVGAAADEILVQLNDGREMVASLVGRDPRSDLAVLKVDAEDLPHISIADSDQIEVGDVVFAIGNPMGVGLTITQGIISATGRDNLEILGEAGFESFIQTDAPINPGNSGGALVDAYGRLIGINTALLSESGGSIGLGFAIPSVFAREIAMALARDGVVLRGLIGLSLGDLDADYAEAFGVSEGGGVLVQSVFAGLPAERAGLRRGDVILEVGGAAIGSVSKMRLRLAASPPGEVLEIKYKRDGALLVTKVELADPENPYGRGGQSGMILDGIRVELLNDAQRRANGFSSRVKGLLVMEAADNSAYRQILRPGAVLMEVDGQQLVSVEQARQLLSAGEVSRAYVLDRGRAAYYALRP